MFVTPEANGTDQQDKCTPKIGKRILYSGWHHRIDLFSNQLMVFEFFQLDIQYPPGNVRNLALKFAWAQVALVNEPQDPDLPFAIKDLTDQVKSTVQGWDGLFFIRKYKYTTGLISEQYG